MAFCPTGKAVDPLPVMYESDVIEVFALKKPVWQSKIGPLLKYFVRIIQMIYLNSRTKVALSKLNIERLA